MADRVFIASTGLFAGVALGVTLVAAPVVDISTTKKRDSWAKLYENGRNVVVPLVLTTAISGGLLYYKTPNPRILAATIIGAFPAPFTILAMRSTNLAIEASSNSDPKVNDLLKTWNQLHNVRTLAGLVSFGLAVYALV
ncbi:hypothetical protein NQZ79_g5183 [Umbelopsis isabellina]|nr:hypothetical protein NQZ79_g5183 [Umbelopsis isabellina]